MFDRFIDTASNGIQKTVNLLYGQEPIIFLLIKRYSQKCSFPGLVECHHFGEKRIRGQRVPIVTEGHSSQGKGNEKPGGDMKGDCKSSKAATRCRPEQ